MASTFGVATPGEKDFVKRVIAVGGQTVQCCDEQGRVTVDGRPLDEPYVYSADPKFDEQPFGPVTVPAGHLWVMGDHRDESADSRAHVNDADQGTVPVDNVIGKAFVIIWPVEPVGDPGHAVGLRRRRQARAVHAAVAHRDPGGAGARDRVDGDETTTPRSAEYASAVP